MQTRQRAPNLVRVRRLGVAPRVQEPCLGVIVRKDTALRPGERGLEEWAPGPPLRHLRPQVGLQVVLGDRDRRALGVLPFPRVAGQTVPTDDGQEGSLARASACLHSDALAPWLPALLERFRLPCVRLKQEHIPSELHRVALPLSDSRRGLIHRIPSRSLDPRGWRPNPHPCPCWRSPVPWPSCWPRCRWHAEPRCS